MISIGVREFRKKLKEYLAQTNKAPMKITARGKILAVIASEDFFEYLVLNQNTRGEESQVNGTKPGSESNGAVLPHRLVTEPTRGGISTAGENTPSN